MLAYGHYPIRIRVEISFPWRGVVPDYFAAQAGLLNLFQQQMLPNWGFRPGQLGALHAALAHFSVQDDPSIVCLPTGYGKTSLMMALPLLMCPKQILIAELPQFAHRIFRSRHSNKAYLALANFSVEYRNPEVQAKFLFSLPECQT